MVLTQMKYNPGLSSDAELIRTFVVRGRDLEMILEVLNENTGPSNQHLLVVGARGLGKTTLAHRVAAEVRTNESLKAQWYPLVFAEEAYEIGSPGEFWLEALFRLGEQTGEERWIRAYEDLKPEPDDARLRERALAQLMDFADEEGKRILLICENLNMILGQQLGNYDDWDLRHTLLNEPRIMLLATAISRFEEIDNIDKAWYDIFSIHELKPLNTQESTVLWKSLTRQNPTVMQLRPLEILTGGNPRLLRILADFAEKTSFRELIDNLIRLIDEHTEYFKSQLDSLAPVERKVFVSLLDIWEPATTSEVAQAARLQVNKTSTLLGRLIKRGAVMTVEGAGPKQLYQATERLYNIYYLMRRRGHPSNRVRALAIFMVQFYPGDELVGRVSSIVDEACRLAPERRQEHYWAYDEILKHTPDSDLRLKILKSTPEEFFNNTDAPHSVRRLRDSIKTLQREPVKDTKIEGSVEQELDIDSIPKDAEGWVERGIVLLDKLQKIPEAEEAFRKAIELEPDYHRGWGLLGEIFHEKLNRPEEAEQAYRKAIELKSDYAWAWDQLGLLLHEELNRPEEAEQAYRKSIELESDDAWTWVQLGRLLHYKLNRPEEAEQAYRKALELKPVYAWTWIQLGLLLHNKLNRPEEAEQAYRKAIELQPDYAWAWDQLGLLLHEELNRPEEAEQAYRKAIELQPDYAWAWIQLGLLLHNKLNRPEEAEQAYRKAIELQPDYAWAWDQLGLLLHEELNRPEEAEQAYRNALELKPDVALGWAKLGQLLHEQLNRPKEAEQAYRKSIELESDDAWTWVQLGRLLHNKLNRPEEAEQAYRKAIELESDNAWAWDQLGLLLHEQLNRPEEAEQAYRKSIELESDDAWTWVQLGRLLHYKLNRPEEAEQAYRKATELESDYAWTWGQLGLLLHEELNRPEEAEQAYRNALELKPDVALGWAKLGQLLHEQLNRPEEAEQAYRKATELESDYAWAWAHLGQLLHKELNRYDEAEEVFQTAIKSLPEDPEKKAEGLNNLAWSLYETGEIDYMVKAEALARKSVEIVPDDWITLHTLATILGAQDKWEEALNLAPSFIAAAATDNWAVRDVTEFLISAAAAGYPKEALQFLVDSEARGALEPLEVGLRLFMNETPRTAQEILEVGKDVAERIRERQRRREEAKNETANK